MNQLLMMTLVGLVEEAIDAYLGTAFEHGTLSGANALSQIALMANGCGLVVRIEFDGTILEVSPYSTYVFLPVFGRPADLNVGENEKVEEMVDDFLAEVSRTGLASQNISIGSSRQ